MGKSSPSVPQGADPQAVADAQMAVNRASYADLFKYNVMDQVTPNGTLTYTQMPDGRYMQTNSLSPAAQATYDAQNKNTLLGAGAIGNALQQIDPTKQFVYDSPLKNSFTNAGPALQGFDSRGIPKLLDSIDLTGVGQQSSVDAGGLGRILTGLDTSGVNPMQSSIDMSRAPALQSGIDMNAVGNVQRGLNTSGLPSIQNSVGGADEAARQQTIDAVYGQMKSRLDPQWSTEQKAQIQSLADRGITLESAPEAYKTAMDQFSRGRNDAYQSALNNAITQGGQEQSRLFDLGLEQGRFRNSAQQQGWDQALGAGNFSNSAQAQAYGQAANNLANANQARSQYYNEAMGQAGLANQANQQGYGQALNTGQFQNSGVAQQLAQMLGIQAGNNSAQNNAFNQAASNAAFRQSANAQQFGQNAQAMQLNNAANQQGWTQGLGNANLWNQAQQQGFGQAQTQYQMPYNNLAMLQGQGNTLMPSYQGYNTMQAQAAPNMGDLYKNQYQGQLDAYNAQVGSQNSQNQAIGGVASAAMMAAAMF